MNTFTCQWLNRLDQFDRTDIDLIIVHDQGVIPQRRVSKNFETALINSAFLEDWATTEVGLMVDEWNEANA